jgi:ankyrin repeat protein
MKNGWGFLLVLFLALSAFDQAKADLGGMDDFFLDSSFGGGGYRRAGAPRVVSLDLDPQNILDSSFRIAAREGRMSEMKKLLLQGADIDSRSGSGETALMYAARNCSPKLAELLIQKGAQVNARDFEGRTPLIYAASGSCRYVVELLAKVSNLEFEARDRSKRTALDYAAENALLEVDGPSEEIIHLIQMGQKNQKRKPVRTIKVSRRGKIGQRSQS